MSYRMITVLVLMKIFKIILVDVELKIVLNL